MQSGSGKLTFLRTLLCALTCATMAQAGPNLQLSSDASWSLPEPWFGGFSGIEVSADGMQATLITDKGTLARAAMSRKNGKIIGLQLLNRTTLKHANGNRVRGKSSDAEGLAVGPNGKAYVSFERRHRVAELDLASGRTHPLPKANGFARFEPNSGLEALAIHPDGTLYALPEKSAARRAAFDLFAYDGQRWRVSHKIPRRGPFLPVGADFDARGLFYLLERAATPLGFRSRIRRFNLVAGQQGEETLLTTIPTRFDNLEALSVWQDTTGATRLTMISDDNFLRIQRTQIVEFILTE